MAALHWLVFAAFLACAAADFQRAQFQKCNEASQDICAVKEVRIDPCNTRKCKFIPGRNASISFDFDPSFAASKLTTTLYWANGDQDVEFDQMTNVNACNFTPCPTQPGQSQTLAYTLYIGKRLPLGSYTFKWKLWNADDNTQLCCFKTSVQIRRK